MSDPKVSEVKGTIILEDGTTSEFSIGKDFGWSQWGAVQERLSQTVEVLDAMVVGLQQEEVRFVSDYDEPEDKDEDWTCPADCSPDNEDSMDGPCSECGTDWRKYDGGDYDEFRRTQRAERESNA